MSRREKPVWSLLCHMCGRYFNIVSTSKDRYLTKAESVAAKLSGRGVAGGDGGVSKFTCLTCKKGRKK
jgi:predicted nucleic acid-binding Zn ribbon protein